LQAIENDQLTMIPSMAQARGFIRLYANFLDLDPYSLLEPRPVEIPIPAENSVAAPVLPKVKETSIKEKLDEAFQQGSERLTDRFQDGSDRVKETVQKITDKLPYKIVKNAEPGEIKPVEKTSRPIVPSGPTYLAMCRSIGADLRKQRESLGLSLADIERQTRIREVYLYAIEEGNLDDLPSTVQGRGMLSNYAAFMNLNADSYLTRFADALQQRRAETVPEKNAGVPIPMSEPKQPITGWRRLLSPDMIFTGSLFLVFFVMIIWGSFQLMGIGSESKTPATVIPISDVLLASGTPAGTDMVTIVAGTSQSTAVGVIAFTPSTNLASTLSAPTTGAVQVVVSAHRRTYMKITVDGKDAFVGLVVPGNVYTYSADTKITLLTGDGSALQVYYNQKDLGLIGIVGEVVNLEFTVNGSSNLASNYTPTPTVTQAPTLTPNPTLTPTPTQILPTATISPLAPSPIP
jgi:cytoskeleton protein RodZ